MKVVLLVALLLLAWAVVRAVRHGRGAADPTAVRASRHGKLAVDLAHDARQGQGQDRANGPGGFGG